MRSVLAVCLCLAVCAASVKVEVELRAPWDSSVLWPVQETAEALGDWAPDLFWKFVDSVDTELDASSSSSDASAAAAEAALDAAEPLLSPQSYKLVRLSVLSRAHTPAVNLHQQLRTTAVSSTADDCTAESLAWAVVGPSTNTACTVDDLSTAVSTAVASLPHSPDDVPQVFGFDHVYPSSSSSSSSSSPPLQIIVYGVLGSPQLKAMHDAVVGLSSADASYSLRYVLRHGNPDSASTPTPLQGFGFGFDIKNMEYKALDDRTPQEDTSSATDDDDDDDTGTADAESDVEGLLFDTLVRRRPDLADSLKQLKADLSSSEDDIKVWDMADIGYQATGHVLALDEDSSRPDSALDPLTRLTQLTGNFPSLAKWVTRLPVNDRLKAEANHNAQTVRSTNIVLVNGSPVDVTAPSFNLFQLFSTLRGELALQDSVSQLPVSPDNAVKLRAAAETFAHRSAAPTSYRIDIRPKAKGAIFFVNNLEKDPQYKTLSKSLNTLLMPSYQLPAVRKNVFNVVAVLDPVSLSGLAALHLLLFYLDNHVALRVGFVLTSSELVAGNAAVTGDSGSPPSDSALATGEHVGLLLATAVRKHGRKAGVTFLRRLTQQWRDWAEAQEAQTGPTAAPTFTVADVVEVYTATAKASTKSWTSGAGRKEAVAALSGDNADAVHDVQASAEFVRFHNMPFPSYTVNGALVEGLNLQETLMTSVYQELQTIQMMLQSRQLRDGQNVLRKLLSGPQVVVRHHPVILAPPSDQLFVDMHGADAGAVGANGFVHSPTSVSTIKPVSVVVVDDLSVPAALTTVRSALSVLGGDLDAKDDDTDAGSTSTSKSKSKAAKKNKTADDDRLGSLPPSHMFRLSVVHVGDDTASVGALLAAAWQSVVAATDVSDPAAVTSAVSTLSSVVQAAIDAAGDVDAFKSGLSEASVDGSGDVVAVHSEGIASLLESPPSDEAVAVSSSSSSAATAAAAALRLFSTSKDPAVTRGVLANARLLPVDASRGNSFDAHDVVLLCRSEVADRSSAVFKALGVSADRQTMGLPVVTSDAPSPSVDTLSSVASQLTSVFAKYGASGGRTSLPAASLSRTHTHFKTGPSDAAIVVQAMLDPLSVAAQRSAPLLLMLRDVLGASVEVQLMPEADVSDLPLKSFYRFVAPGAQPLLASPLSSRATLPPAMASFASVPTHQILTSKMYPPEPLNVQASVAGYDLDNLRLDQPGVPRTVRVQYAVKDVLVAGQCDDLTSSAPPNGLQLVLHSSHTHSSAASDTLVMQNLGYFQLKANPGVWTLGLASGRASQLYNIVTTADEDAAEGGLMWIGRRGAGATVDGSGETVVSHKQVVVRDFEGRVTQLRVRKKPGMEALELLEKPEDDPVQDGLWAKMSSMFGGGGATDSADDDADDDDTVHVFSLASGHLYERFLKIMMASVVKRSSSKIKFWLVENFLSPAFKEFVPSMAEEYGFEVGLVTYKWPNWLRQQTEQQRIIWGYKILFLDVLFPLNLKKVIYVDADQVLRTDIRELWDLDLEGKPYGYTPFCTSREETLGFQFWQQGYWKDHLRDRPYHISALYVVDLQMFRRQAVGDKLRAIYDQLSRDPNSLSNLDQDLPNYAQHMVPIHSLPIEWLWCESWCSDDSKAASKTIDLCNNPLHKEPKLDMARRVISGDLFPESWVELDAEVAALEAKVAAGGGK